MEFKVGDGATIVMWSDRYASTVVEVSPSGRTVKVQRDIATRIDNRGMSVSQKYTYEPDPSAPVQTFTLRKNGRYIEKGDPIVYGVALAKGRSEYYDYSF